MYGAAWAQITTTSSYPASHTSGDVATALPGTKDLGTLYLGIHHNITEYYISQQGHLSRRMLSLLPPNHSRCLCPELGRGC